MPDDRSKRHHFVTRANLRRFANENEILTTLDLTTGIRFAQHVDIAGAINNYNEVIDDEGQKSDFVEQELNDLDGAGATAIQRIDSGEWPIDDQTKLELACFLSYQYMRVPQQRTRIDELSDYMMKADVAIKGPDELRRVEEANGRFHSDEEFATLWESMTQFGEYRVVQHQNEKIKLALELAQDMVGFFYKRGWAIVRFERKTLLTSDAPVTLMQWEEHRQPLMGVGLINADELWFPLGRRCALLMSQHIDDGSGLNPSVTLANTINQRTIAFADRWLYFHPDDDPTVGLNLERPRERFKVDGPTPEELARHWEVKPKEEPPETA